MTYHAQYSTAAARQLKRLDKGAQRQIRDAVVGLALEPRPPGAKALSGQHGLLRVRTGDYRIVYTVDDGELLILVVALGHRREVYRNI